MLHVLPIEVTLSVLSHLPIPSLLSLPVLSRQWLGFFASNQSAIFRNAALLHEYIQPGTLFLEDALSVNTGRPWAGSTSWKDFCNTFIDTPRAKSCAISSVYLATRCPPLTHFSGHSHCEGHRSFQLCKNWEGKGRAVARAFSPPGLNVHSLKVDEKAGICIMTCIWGGLNVTHLFSGIVLWCLPMVRDFFFLTPSLGIPLGAQTVAYSHTSPPVPTSSMTTDISSLTVTTKMGRGKSGVWPANLLPRARSPPMRRLRASRWTCPPAPRRCTISTHHMGSSGPGPC